MSPSKDKTKPAVKKPRAKPRDRTTAIKDGPDLVDVHVGERIRKRREILKISQKELGKAIDVSFQQIQKYENGKNRVSASRLFDVSRLLDVSISYFFDGIDQDLMKARLAQGRKGAAIASGLSEAGPSPFKVDPTDNNESLELLHAFWKIKRNSARNDLLELAKAMATQKPGKDQDGSK